MKETRIKPGDKVRFSDYGREKYESENDFLFKSEEDMEIYTVENIFLLFDNINNPGKLTLLKRGQKYFHIDFVEHRQNRFDLDWFEKVTPVSSEYYDVGSFGYIDNLIFNFQEDNGYDPDTLVIGGFYLYDLKKISNDDDIKKYLIKPLKLRMSEYSVCYVTRTKERPPECSSGETKPETINQRRKRLKKDLKNDRHEEMYSLYKELCLCQMNCIDMFFSGGGMDIDSFVQKSGLNTQHCLEIAEHENMSQLVIEAIRRNIPKKQ